MSPIFSKRHYEFLANWAAPNLTRKAVQSLACALAQDNDKFDQRKFLETYTRVRAAIAQHERMHALAAGHARGDSFDRRAAHKAANLGRGMWEYHSCWKCHDGRVPAECPVACIGACEYPSAIND